MKTTKPLKKKYIDGKLVLLLAGFYALFDLVLISKKAYLHTYDVQGMEMMQDFSLYHFLVYNLLLDFVIVLIFMSLIAISTKRFLNKNYSWTSIIAIHVLFSLLIGLVIRIFIDLYFILVGESTFANYDFTLSIFKFMYVIDLNFLIYFAMVFIIYTYYYVKEVKKVEIKQGKLKTQLVNTRMKMLSSQLQPHFLFNTLNSISVLTDIDGAKAKDTIADLSDFLREILYDNESNKITLERELRILEYYLNIIKVRFSEHIEIIKQVDASLLTKKVPALLLQPILENSMKHGYDYNHTDLTILIQIYSQENTLVLKIENNGALISSGNSVFVKNGLGLVNIKDRLLNLYGSDFIFEVKNRIDASGVETLIRIPLED